MSCTPFFDQAEYLPLNKVQLVQHAAFIQHAEFFDDFELAIAFLTCYQGSPDTFNAYRREIERLFQWIVHVHGQPLHSIDRSAIMTYIQFVQSPPASWIATQHHPRFLAKDGMRVPHIKWRPFVVRTPKAMKKNTLQRKTSTFEMSQSALKSTLAILSTFYTFLQQEQYLDTNPIRLIRQKNALIQKTQNTRISRKLSHDQWRVVIIATQAQADLDAKHERHLFVLSCLYLMGLRISELAPNHLHTPTMGDFSPDDEERWWFTAIGKGNKIREIAVPDDMLFALKRYRKTLGLTPLPMRKETTPLIPKHKGRGGLGIRQIRHIVQACFDLGIDTLYREGKDASAQDLCAATVHWLRHTAITADIKHRPREHVRDDAGHENAATTDRYIDSDRSARHESAQKKPLVPVSQT